MLMDRLFVKQEEPAAALAQVSYALEAGDWGAVADQEYRHRPTVSPGGYRWCPREGEQVLLLHTGDGDLCAGVPGDSRGLAPGEVEITGPGGSSIRLRADGAVVINGRVIPPAQAGAPGEEGREGTPWT